MFINKRVLKRAHRPFRIYGALFAILFVVCVSALGILNGIVMRVMNPSSRAITKLITPTPTPSPKPNDIQQSFIDEVKNRWGFTSISFVDPVAVVEWQYDAARDSFIIIEEKIPMYYHGYANGAEMIGEYTRKNKLEASYSFFTLVEPGAYSLTHMLSYQPRSHTLSLITTGGDGCGGNGSVWTLTGTRSTTVLDFGMGCVRKPIHYVGDFPKAMVDTRTDIPTTLQYTVLLGDVRFEGQPNDVDEPLFQSVYALDPVGGRKVTLLTKKDLPDQTVHIYQDRTNPLILRMQTKGNQTTHDYDLITKKFLDTKEETK